MEKKKLEDFFKDKFEDFEADVKSSIWENIQTALKGAGLGFLGKTIINKIGGNLIITIISSAVAVVGTIAVVNWSKDTSIEKTNLSLSTVNLSKTSKQPSLIVNPMVSSSDNFLTKTAEKDKFSNAESEKGTIAEPTIPTEQKLEESKALLVRPSKNDKKAVKLKINEEVASIFASPIAGPAPLFVNFTNSGNGTVNQWKFSDDKNALVTSTNPVHVFDKPGVYTIMLTSTNADGAKATDNISIEVTNSPNTAPTSVFTPNNDGVNDFFVFQSKNIIKMKAEIFDKRGFCVYSYNGIGGKWDGKNKMGEEVENGIYYYIISAEGTDRKKYERKGTISLTK